MVIRMFEYGFKKAKELTRHESADETVIYIPKQLVIFVEQNKNIRDELRLRLIFPDGEEVKYKVPVMKYWEYETPDILEQKLYPLLPLQVFKLRHRMEQIKRKKGQTRGQIEKAIMEAKELTVTVAREGRRLFDQKEINGNDLHEILMAAYYIFEYLNNRYLKIKQLNKEVHKMLKTLHDPAVEQRGIEKGREEGREEVARQMLLEGEDVEKITKYTGLSKEKIKKLKT